MSQGRALFSSLKTVFLNEFKRDKSPSFLFFLVLGPFLCIAPLKLDAQTVYTKLKTEIVVDYKTNRSLYEKKADSRIYPASMTKMMTLYLLFEDLNAKKITLRSRLKVSKRASGQPASKLYLSAGETLSVHNAIQALTVKSANDVAVTIAENLSSSESRFAVRMTKKAKKLGMTRTVFRNASGLPNRLQYSTARDMARLGRALIRDFPQYYKYFKQNSFRFKGNTHYNHNSILKTYKGADGLKTGYINASGYNLTASAKRSGRRLVAVITGSSSSKQRSVEMERLLNRGFSLSSKIKNTVSRKKTKKSPQKRRVTKAPSYLPALEKTHLKYLSQLKRQKQQGLPKITEKNASIVKASSNVVSDSFCAFFLTSGLSCGYPDF